MKDVKQVVAPTWTADIHMGGDFRTAKQALRQFCRETPCCVSLWKTDYVFTHGCEKGFTARVLNYPRFPAESAALSVLAIAVAAHLATACEQGSWSVVAPNETFWFTRRGDSI